MSALLAMLRGDGGSGLLRELPKIGVELRRQNRTTGDRNDLVRALAIKAEFRRFAPMAHDERHLVAIGARVRHSDRFAYCDAGEATDSMQRFTDDVRLPLELRGIVEMLELATAALAEDGTERIGAVRRLN